MWLPLLYLQLLVVSVRSLQNTDVIYTANVEACSSQLFNNRDILELQENISAEIDCMRRCTRDVQCELAVYQEFQDGTTSCTKLTRARDNPSATLDVSASRRCVAMLAYPCLNRGQLYEGVCLCQDGFSGPACENSNFDSCNADWTLAATSFMDGSIIFDEDISTTASHSNSKVIFQDEKLKVRSVMTGMDVRIKLSPEIYWPLVTFPFFEKVRWNKFAENSERQFIHFLFGGNLQLLSFNSTAKSFKFSFISENFFIVLPRKTRYAIIRSMPDYWILVKEYLENGYEIYGSTWENVDNDNKLVLSQLTDRRIYKLENAQFATPPQLYVRKCVLGEQPYVARITMSAGEIYAFKNDPIIKMTYLNPCWTRMTDDKYDGRASLIGWKMLGTYLRLGHDVRVKVGPTYHTVLEVIQIGDSFNFVLAPSLSPSDTSTFTIPLYGVRSLISSSAIYQSCTHQIEGEKVIEQSMTKSMYNVTWFVDTRTWKKVFAVFSNSSVVHGSVADLVSGVYNGSDVRVWIKWLNSDLSRFLDTHMSSVTGDGKVSTESKVTWKTYLDPGVAAGLNLSCDYMEYALMTSDGHLEILMFNVWTPGRSTVHEDVMITWFLS